MDKGVHNPARIAKVPGTLARKGDATPDRPHRRGGILEIPAETRPVPVDLLDALAAEATPKASASVTGTASPQATPDAKRDGKAAGKHRLDVARWLTDRGVAFRVKDAKDAKGRTVFALERCPFNADHADAAVMQADSGKLAFHCFHESCAGRGWQDCKEAIGKPDSEHWDPPLRAKGAGEDDKDEGGSHAVQLTALALAAVQLFHDGDTAYGSVADTPATFPLARKVFRQKLSHLFFRAKRRVPSGEALKAALDTLCGKAIFDGPNIPVHVRLAELDAAIYLDLGREDFAAVRITRDGWDVLSNYPVRFRHPRGMKPLPVPTRGGNLAALRALLNVADDVSWRLLVGWLLAAFRPTGPYPVLVLTGEHGSAKSTTGRLLRSLTDPNAAPLRSAPRDGARPDDYRRQFVDTRAGQSQLHSAMAE